MKGSLAGLSGPLALVLLLPMEAGVPVPLPADLVMFTVGERVAAGRFPLWLAVAGFEVIAVLGTTVLFLACRGPAQRIIARFGPLADRAFNQAKGPALGAAAVLIAGALVFWRVRRRRRAAAPGAWMEAACPACVGLNLLAGHVPALAGLDRLDHVSPGGPPGPGPDGEPEVLAR